MAGGYLWQVIQHHIDMQRYRPTERQIADELGVAPQTLTKWKRPVGLPARDSLVAIARLTGVPYRDVLDAALMDIDYLPKEGEGSGDTAPNTPAPLTAGQWDELAQDLRRRGLSERTIVAQLGVRPVDTQPGEVHTVAPGDVAGHTGESRRTVRGA